MNKNEITLEAKKTLSKNITTLMARKNKKRREVSKETGITYANLSDWINCRTYPRLDKIDILCKYFGVKRTELCDSNVEDGISFPSNIFPITKKSFPVLGNVACGEPLYAYEERGVSVDADADIHADFCLRCEGESMTGDGIADGDIVFIRKQPMVSNGEIACIIIDDEATLKHFYRDDKQVTLVASNPSYAPMVFRESDCKNIKILGKAVALTRIL